MQTPSGHCRCKKTQTPSRHGPKTAQTASQKTVSRYLWNPHKTIFGATEHTPSLCKHHLDTADAKRPKHHLDTSRKPPKPQAKKLFHVTFGIPINNLWSHRAHAQPMQTPSGHCRCKKTQTPSRHGPKTAQTASQKTVYVTFGIQWNPHKTIFGATDHKPSLCKHKPMQTPSGHCRCKKTQTPSRHGPKTAQTASQKTVSRYLWNPMEST